MKKYIGIVFCLILVNYAASALAAEQVQYQQKKLPDGSIEMDYSGSDGTKVKQIENPDGSRVIDATDAKGNETITTQDKNGNVQVQTKKAS